MLQFLYNLKPIKWGCIKTNFSPYIEVLIQPHYNRKGIFI